MTKIFYDKLTNLKKVEKKIKKVARTPEEREELYQLVDDILHHRVLGKILEKLPESHHSEFLDEFKKKPHDESLFEFLGKRIEGDVKEFIKSEIHALAVELLLIIEEKTK